MKDQQVMKFKPQAHREAQKKNWQAFLKQYDPEDNNGELPF